MDDHRLTLIAGLYSYTRNGNTHYPAKTILEIEKSIQLNPWYRTELICYTDSIEMANCLRNLGLYVHRIFDDAPREIIADTAHKMKHWIVLNAIKEFNHVLWIDWDTYSLKPIDHLFLQKCFGSPTPKFTLIENYWAVVNCAIYYANQSHIELMERSLTSIVTEPNDELLWNSVLPSNIHEMDYYWFHDYVINIWQPEDLVKITSCTYFLHLRDFEMLKCLKLKSSY